MKFSAMVVANIKMTIRNKQALFFLFIFPLLFMGLFGVIFGGGQGSATIAVVKQDKSPMADRLGAALKELDKSDAFTVKTMSKDAAMDELKSTKVSAVIVLKSGFSSDLPKKPAAVELYYDPSSTQSQMMRGSVESIINSIERSMIDRPPLMKVETISVQAKQTSYIDFLLPGILAMSLMNSGLYGISASTVARREKGILRRLKLTPMPLSQFIGAGIVNQLLVSIVQSLILIAVGHFAFGVQIIGSFAPMLVAIILGSLCFITVGFTIASFAKTVDAANTLGNIVGMPMMFLGGVFFPVDNAPAWIQPLVKAMPLKYLADSLRGIMINGESFASIQTNMLILLAVTSVLFLVSVKFFKWESDRR